MPDYPVIPFLIQLCNNMLISQEVSIWRERRGAKKYWRRQKNFYPGLARLKNFARRRPWYCLWSTAFRWSVPEPSSACLKDGRVICEQSSSVRRAQGHKKKLRGGRRRENMSFEEEVAFLAPFFERASKGGILVVGEIKQELDERLERRTALASAYNLLHRHGWRKLAPDRRHPKADIEAQEEWKKNSPRSSRKSTTSGAKKGHSG